MSQDLKNMTFIWCLLLVGTFLAANISTVESDLTTIQYILCNTYTLSPYDPFFDEVYEALDKIVAEAPKTPDKVHDSIDTNNGVSAYAYGDCDPKITEDDCGGCLREIAADFYYYCGAAIGAQIGMTSCYMRYEDYNFF